MKRGQIINQILFYVLSAMIFTMVLIYGYKAVHTLQTKANYVSLVELKTELESSIKEIAITHNEQKKAFSVPSGCEKVCFFDNTRAYDAMQCEGKINHIVCDAWKSNTSENIFLIPLQSIVLKSVKIELRNSTGRYGALCFSTSSGKLRLKMTGEGDRTLIQPLEG